MGENERWCVERWIRAPPALPLRVLVPSGRAELSRAHDLGADCTRVLAREGIVEAAAPPRLARVLVPPARGEHPFMQSFARMTERCLAALRLTRAETVE